MGRGVAYGYDYMMLFDEDAFAIEFDDESEFDEESYKDWLGEIAERFKAWKSSRHVDGYGPEALVFAESERLILGVDWGGAVPCLFVDPKTYHPSPCSLKERTYSIDREVARVFNALVREREGMFSYPTSGWTSRVLSRYSPREYV